MNNHVKTVAENERCCACMACKNVCPKDAITFVPDKYGFPYPRVNGDVCISCGKCAGVCRFSADELKANDPKVCYAAVNRDTSVLKKSSSGGVFGALADLVIGDGGYVFGAAYDDELNVRHICVSDKSGLDKLHGSKYLQSDVGMSYNEVKKLLNDGKKVLFSGTPCQVDALYSVLGNTDTNDLITVDLICHGAPNTVVFHHYLEYLGKKNGVKVVRYSFRSKKRDWRSYCSEYDYQTKDGTTKTVILGRYDEYYHGEFLNGNISREDCSSCKYAARKRVGDFTMGDFWGYKNGNVTLAPENGLSVFTANNEKALRLTEALKERLELCETDYAIAVSGNEALRNPTVKGKKRERILGLIVNGKSKKVYREYRTKLFFKKAKRKIKTMLKRR